LWISGI